MSYMIYPSSVYAGRTLQRTERFAGRISWLGYPTGAQPNFRSKVLSFAALSSTNTSWSACQSPRHRTQSSLASWLRSAASLWHYLSAESGNWDFEAQSDEDIQLFGSSSFVWGLWTNLIQRWQPHIHPKWTMRSHQGMRLAFRSNTASNPSQFRMSESWETHLSWYGVYTSIISSVRLGGLPIRPWLGANTIPKSLRLFL